MGSNQPRWLERLLGFRRQQPTPTPAAPTSDGVFRLDKVRTLVEDRATSPRRRELAEGFRVSLGSDDIEAARQGLLEFLQLSGGGQDVRGPKMLRALMLKSDDTLANQRLYFAFVDGYPIDTPLGRTVCQKIAVHRLIAALESYINEIHTPQEIVSRSAFYANLQKNIETYVEDDL